MLEYFDDYEFELFQYDDDSDDDDIQLDPEEWQDLNSEELLNVWMTIVEYHEINYLPLKKTFNQLCEFVYKTQDQNCFVSAPEIQAIKNHEFVQGRDWEYFFSE